MTKAIDRVVKAFRGSKSSHNGNKLLFELIYHNGLKTFQARASFFIFVGNLAVGDIMILTFPIWSSIHGLFNNREISQAEKPGNSLTGQ